MNDDICPLCHSKLKRTKILVPVFKFKSSRLNYYYSLIICTNLNCTFYSIAKFVNYNRLVKDKEVKS